MNWNLFFPFSIRTILWIVLIFVVNSIILFIIVISFVSNKHHYSRMELMARSKALFETSYRASFSKLNDMKRSFFLSASITRNQSELYVIRMLDAEGKVLFTYPQGALTTDILLTKSWTAKLQNKIYHFEIFNTTWHPNIQLATPMWELYFIVIGITFFFLTALFWVLSWSLAPIRQVSFDIESIKYSLPSSWKPIRQLPHKHFVNNLITSINELVFRAQRSLVCQENIGRFLAHEIKTPLTNLMNEIELESEVFTGGMITRAEKTFHDQAMKDIEKIYSIVNNICELSYTNKTRHLDKEVNLVQLLSSFICDFDYYYKLKVHVEVIDGIDNISVKINPDYFWILCSNILRNSIEHGNAKVITPSVRISDDNDRFKIEFLDEGNGFPFPNNILSNLNCEKNIKQLLKSHGSGLVLCLKLVEIMNMSIKLENRVTRGACVSLWVWK